MTNYTVLETQSIIDVALQVYGDAQYAVQLCLDNNLTLDSELHGGTVLVYDETLNPDTSVTGKYKLQLIYVATTTQDQNNTLLEHSDSEHVAVEHN